MRIYDRTFNLFGCEVRLRILPKAFKYDMKVINEHIDTDNLEVAKHATEEAIKVWGCDEDLVRASALIGFLLGE